MNISAIHTADIANGEGMRLSLFVSGCTQHCPGCFNPETWDFNNGRPFTSEITDYLIRELSNNYYDGLTILGGEPLHPRNIYTVLNLVRLVRTLLPDKTIWIYTGYTLENLTFTPTLKSLLMRTDVLVDGAYIQELHDISLRYRGSSNQRIIDIPRTLCTGTTTIYHPAD